jgi:hypothetical protein
VNIPTGPLAGRRGRATAGETERLHLLVLL